VAKVEELPFGWVRKANGDFWDGPDAHAKPVLYRVANKWMVAGARSPMELHVIARLAEHFDG